MNPNIQNCILCKGKIDLDKDTSFIISKSSPDIQSAFTLLYCKHCFRTVAGDSYTDCMERDGFETKW